MSLPLLRNPSKSENAVAIEETHRNEAPIGRLKRPTKAPSTWLNPLISER